MTDRIPSFLVVDDDVVAVMAVRRMIKALDLANSIHVAADGIQALELLRGTDDNGALGTPHIVILDLNMPRMTGHEFLAEIRRDSALAKTVVFVMTTSDSPCDIADAYSANVAGYITKDASPESLRHALSMISEFSKVVTLPA